MQISIVTPVYNEPRIQRTLNSILGQRCTHEIEIIVVDGNSTDETTEIIDKYAGDIDLLVQEPDEGTYDAMNKGIEHAAGDIVGILNADDRYQHAHVLQSVAQTFESDGAELCYGDLVYVDRDDRVVRYWKSGDYRAWRFYFGWMPPHPTVFVRKELYQQHGGFDLRFPIAADYEFLLRVLLTQEVSAAYIEDILVRMATGGQSNSSVRNIVQANKEVYRAWQKHDLRGGTQVPLLKPVRKPLQYIRADMLRRISAL